MTESFRPCAVIPTFDNPLTVAGVVEEVRRHLGEVIVVDDGSRGPGRDGGRRHRAQQRRPHRPAGEQRRQGRRGQDRSGRSPGARVFARAADRRRWSARPGRHSALSGAGGGASAGRRVWGSRSSTARRLGVGGPRTGSRTSGRASRRRAPRSRTRSAATASIRLPAACEVAARSDRMDFDIEIAVRLVWAGVPHHQRSHARAVPSARGWRRFPLPAFPR